MIMNFPRVGLGVFIFKDGKFLMIERQGSHGAGSWSVPGGWMEPGESFEETAKREIKEEVGIKIRNLRFGAITNNIFPEDDLHSVTVWMLSEYDSGEVENLEPQKISRIAWKDFDSLPPQLFKPWDELLKSEFITDIKKQLQ